MPRQPILSVLGHVDSGKCVAPETRIQLANGELVEAEKLFEKEKDEGSKLGDKEGEVYKLENGPEVFGVEEGELKECNIEAVWKLEKDKLLEFELKDGSRIKVTPEHPFLVIEDGELVFKEAEEIGQEDFVAVPEKLPVEDLSIDELKRQVLEKLATNERFLGFVTDKFSEELYEQNENVEGLLVNSLGYCKKESRFRIADIVKICKNSEIDLVKAYDQIKSIKQATLKQRAGSTSNKIKLPSTPNEFENLGYMAGLMIGDGSREATKLYNNSSKIREEFEESVQNSIGVETDVKTYEKQVDEVYIQCGKTLQEFLSVLFDFPSEQKSHSISLSKLAMRLPENILASLISGYFDADGYVSKKGTLKVTSASDEMIKDLKTALKRFGISAYITQENGYSKINISGKKNLENFSKIGFQHPEKRTRYQKKLENSDGDPITGMTPISGKQIYDARLELGASHTELDIPFQKKYEGYENVSRKYLKEFVVACCQTASQKDFTLNKEEKTQILECLGDQDFTRTEIYEELEIDHRRLLNHVLSLESEKLIRKKGGEEFSLTEKGKNYLSKWKNGEKKILDSLKNVAESELEFVEIENIEERNGGKVYDFTTEAETFVAEDVIVHNTTLLDKIRESKITEGEAGGITQMIGATEVPIDTVEDVCGGLLDQLETDLTIPGVLFIDTPGHAAFSSLRKRGGSISDIAILVIDINEGVQPQTEEALNILQESNTPFIVALNKIDTINGWQSGEELFSKSIQKQNDRIQQQLDEEIYELMGELNEYNVVADRFDRVDNFQKKVAMVPISAETGEGIPELLMVVAGLSQRYLSDQLEVKEGIGKGTALEVSQEQGLGTTVDVIHYDGTMSTDEKLVYGTSEGAKVTDIRALLEPRPLQEIRVDKQYQETDEVHPASGIKVVGKDLEGVVSGAPVRTAKEGEIEQAKEEVEEELDMREFDTQPEGVVVKADSLGSLEAVMREVQEREIPVKKADVGPVTKSDVVEVQNEEPEYQAIISFNVGRTVSGEKAVKEEDIRVFQSDIIYKIVENYEEWSEELQEKQREMALDRISRPAKIRSLPEHVFRSSNPVVAGFKVEKGVLTSGSSLMTLDGDVVGTVKSVQEENETVEKAEKGDQVAVSISGATVGRSFEEGDTLIVNVSRKEYRQLQELEDLLSQGEKDVLDEIVEIKDRQDPHWKIG